MFHCRRLSHQIPYYYFSLVSNLFNPRRKLAKGISPRAYIDELAALGHEPSISHNVVIGAK